MVRRRSTADGARLEPLVAGAFSGETITGYEARLTRRDGVGIDVNLAIAPLVDSNGRAVTVVVIVGRRDRTEASRNAPSSRARPGSARSCSTSPT